VTTASAGSAVLASGPARGVPGAEQAFGGVVVSVVSVVPVVSVVEHLERLNEQFARTWWHWWFFGQTDKPAERIINADPDDWYRAADLAAEMGEANHADLRAALRDPAVVHGMCEDYRAGLSIDRAHEEADRAAGRRVACPTVLLNATEDDIDVHGHPEAIWRPWVGGELAQQAHPFRAPSGRGGTRGTGPGAHHVPG
jgi:haloacetate dehalogenase